MKSGQDWEAKGLPNGVGYTVAESDYAAVGYITKYVGGNETGTIIGNSTIEVNVLNIKNAAASLTVSKTVDGNDKDSDKEFTFTVTFDDPLMNGTYGGVEIINGTGGFTLKGGETIVLEKIPTGTGYTVSEADYSADGYETAVNGGTGWTPGSAASGVIIGDNSSTAQFKNTRNTYGSLKITKAVDGNSGDSSKDFRFTIHVSEPSSPNRVNGQFGDVSISGGYGTFTLKDGESVTLTDLPNGASYSVSESDYTADGYIAKATGASGTIKGYPADTVFDPQEAVFTSTRNTAVLTISKVLAGNAVDKDKKFNFTVTLTKLDASGNTVTDESLSGQYGDLYFVKGVASFRLKGGERVLIKDVQDHTGYTVTEDDYSADGYTTTVNGAVSNTTSGQFIVTTPATAEFTNARSSKGDLTVTKRISGDAATTLGSFDVTITLSNRNISGIYGDVTFINGVAAITLTSNQTVTARGLPNGVRYKVAEADYTFAGYLVSYVGAAGTITEGITQACEITNTKNAVGSLTLLKTLSGNDAKRTRDFAFTITLSDTSIDGTYGNVEFRSGVAQFTLRGGQTKVISGIPNGIEYTVSEEDYSADGYTTATSGNERGTITEDESIVVQFTNTRSTFGSLTVSKVLAGSSPEPNREFILHVVMNDTSINGAYGAMTFTDGEAVLRLKGGESLKAENLPNGMSFTVYVESLAADGYIVTASGDITSFSGGKAKGKIAGNTDKQVIFTNTRYIVGSLTVSKYLDGNDVESDREFPLVVTLIKYDAAGNRVTDITGAVFTEGAATAEGGKANITVSLPEYTNVGIYEYTLKEVAGKTAGITYYANTIKLVVTVVNDTTNGKLRIAAVHTEETGALKSNTFTNTYSAGTLNITKTVEGNLGDKSTYFTFKVTLTGEADKTYGESYAITGGSKQDNPTSSKIGEETTVYLKDGETLSIANLPYGVSYTVVEETPADYTATKEGDTGTIAAAATTAKFTNTKNGNPDTGIYLDSLPYFLALAVVVCVTIGFVVFKKRRADEED